MSLVQPKTVLFVCTGNSCRSQMAEALLRHVAGDRFKAVSAGTRPAGFVHPLALQTLESMGVPSAGLESKSLDAVAALPVDVTITVCDNASAECPTWLRGGVRAHWGLPDPAFHPGTEDDRLQFCRQVAERIMRQIKALAALQIDSLSPEALRQRLEKMSS